MRRMQKAAASTLNPMWSALSELSAAESLGIANTDSCSNKQGCKSAGLRQGLVLGWKDGG